ncbi:MAG: hypothetical protein QOD67_4542 [Caballeronia sp.]|nr:hypothetical protein [Caballeronia sp.]
MKTATFPSVRVEPELREAAESVLEEGEASPVLSSRRFARISCVASIIVSSSLEDLRLVTTLSAAATTRRPRRFFLACVNG